MIEKKKTPGFEITPTHSAVYSSFNPETGEWGPLTINLWEDKTFWASPMSSGLNYGLAVFEGMKAFRHKSGEIFLFRPNDHAQRFSRSLTSLLMPAFPPAKFIEALKLLLKFNKEFVPEYRQGSLYVRPIAYGNDKLGFAFDSKISYTCAFWCSPVGNYYSEGLKPIAVYLARNITRAMPGGLGNCKTAGNYGISRIAQFSAKKQDCQEALFLDGETKQHIEELGAANVFVIKKGVVYTPRLKDTILAGVTRKSIIILAESELRLDVCVKDITVKQLLQADEVFACGTAAVITPIGEIKDGETIKTIGSGEPGEITRKLYDLLTDIQHGDREDRFKWLTKIT